MKERSRILKSVWRILDEKWVRHTVNTPPPNPPQDSETLYDAKAHRVSATRSPRSARLPGLPACAFRRPVFPQSTNTLQSPRIPENPRGYRRQSCPGPARGGSRAGPGPHGDHLTAPRPGRAAPRTTALHISGKGRELRARVEN